MRRTGGRSPTGSHRPAEQQEQHCDDDGGSTHGSPSHWSPRTETSGRHIWLAKCRRPQIGRSGPEPGPQLGESRTGQAGATAASGRRPGVPATRGCRRPCSTPFGCSARSSVGAAPARTAPPRNCCHCLAVSPADTRPARLQRLDLGGPLRISRQRGRRAEHQRIGLRDASRRTLAAVKQFRMLGMAPTPKITAKKTL